MINRVLIRIKVVQLLYSFLLVEKKFMIESQPSNPTKEKRFAYALYLDILLLMVRISERVKGKGGKHSLKDTRFIHTLINDDKIKSLIQKYSTGGFPFAGVEDELSELVQTSGIFRNFEKYPDHYNENDMVWENIYNILIINNPALNDVVRGRENFSMSGVERMKEMMNVTFKNFYATRDNIDDALNTLKRSMEQTRELYIRLLMLPVALTDLREKQLRDNRKKFFPTAEDINPNTRFVDNKLVESLRENEELQEIARNIHVDWLSEDIEFMNRLLKDVMESEVYQEYMKFPVSDDHADYEFWKNIFKQVIFRSEDFLEYMENKSVFWNDDIEITGTFLLKTFKKFEDNDSKEGKILPMYKDREDEEFGKLLFADVVKNKDLYRQYIDKSVAEEKWAADRLAFMDVVVTMTAISEILNFPKIPLLASMNEYIEIAKSYSTSKSGAFVNGLLRSIVTEFQKEGKILKTLSSK